MGCFAIQNSPFCNTKWPLLQMAYYQPLTSIRQECPDILDTEPPTMILDASEGS